MKKLPDNTNQNLALNGDFQKAYEHWKVGAGSESDFQVKGDEWQGEPIRYAQLKNAVAIFQTLIVEVEPAAGARYHLRFLYQNTFKSAPGKVLIGKKGVEDVDKLSIDLPSTGGSTNAQPMAVDFHELAHHLPLDLVLHKGDDLDITLISPRRTSEDSASADIRLTRIELHVELAPLRLLGWVHDNQRFDAGQELHLCLGATQEQRHQLKFDVHPQSEWVGTNASLWAEENPQESIITTPDLGFNQSIEQPWFLDCPLLEGDAPYLFDLNVYSKYTAEPYPVAVSLGHHRLTLNVLKSATFWPVLEHHQTVPLQVQVLSHYTGQPVPGVEVTWCLGDVVLHSAICDGEGNADFDYTPDIDGLQTIEVSVPSPYYNDAVVRTSLEVLVLRDDPLKAVQVRFERMEAAAWGEKTGYPDRGSTYSFSLIFPAASPLLGAQIAVEWSKGGYLPEDLGITSTPDFGEPRHVTGDELEWTLVCGDVMDAPFGLFLSCPMLLRESRDNTLSLARNNLTIGEVREANKSPAVDERDSVYCMVQVLTLNNEPALNVQVDWVLSQGTFTSYTGVGGWASAFDTPTVAGEYEMVAQVKVREGAPPLTHSFPITALASSEWKDDIDFVFDQKIIDSRGVGILCWRGGLHTFRVVPKHPGSPFIGQMITLNWRKGVDPNVGLAFDPPIGTPVLLTQEGHQWAITSGVDRSGIFELEVESGYLSRKRELTGRLMAEKFDDEVELVFDQMTSPVACSTFYPCIGAIHQLTLLPHAFSPLQGLETYWGPVPSVPLPENIELTPVGTSRMLITAGGARYTYKSLASSDKTLLKIFFNLSKFNFSTTPQHFQLDHNKVKVGAVRQAAIDPVMSNGEHARLQVQYWSWFTDLPVPGMPVQWNDTRSLQARSETDIEGWAGHDYEPLVPGPNTVSARVVNLYDGSSVSDDFEVLALSTDPWQDLGVKTVDDPDVQSWAERTFFPRRNGQFDFVLSANEDSYLRGQKLALGISGARPGELGVTMGPATFGQWRTLVDELPCTLIAGDEKDGGFSFRLAASRLLALSPPNAVSLGAGSRAIKMSANNSALQVIDWGSEFKATVTLRSSLSGRAVVGMSVVWDGLGLLKPVSTKTNFYGEASVRYTPTIAGLGQVTATAGDGTGSQSLSFSYTLNEPCEVKELVSDDAHGYPGAEFSARATVVSARTGEPLPDIWVKWKFAGISIEPSKTNSDGVAVAVFKLPFVKQGLLVAIVEGGIAGWDVQSLMVTLDAFQIKRLNAPNGEVVEIGELTLVYAIIHSAVSQQPIDGAEVFWFKDGVEQTPPTKTNVRGETWKNFTVHFEDEMKVDAQIRDPDGAPFDTKSLQFKVLKPTRMINEINGGGSYPIDSDALIQFRVISMTDGKPIAGQQVHWEKNSGPDGTSLSDQGGWVRRQYASEGFIGYRMIRAYILDQSDAVLDQESFPIQFYDPDLP